MSALIIHPHFHRRYTGVTRHVESVVAEQVKEWEVRVVGSRLAPELPRVGWGELLRRVRREPVVWHAHRNNEMLVGLALRLWGRQVRLVFTRHTDTQPTWLTRWLMRRADARVSISKLVAEEMGQSSELVVHGVELERFRPPEEREAAWARLGVGGRYGVGVAGRIRAQKGQGDFLEAVGPLLPEQPEWRAVLVGRVQVQHRRWLRQVLQSLGPPGEQVVLAGEHADVERWYQGLTVLVHPSRSEGFGLVRLEAMAAGCCVVGTRLKALEGLVEHGRTGFLYEPGDVKALRELLRMLMSEPERAREVGRQAAEHVRAQWGVEHEARALGRVYRALLEG